MTSIEATSKLIPAAGAARRGGVRCVIAAQVNDRSLVPFSGRPPGSAGTARGGGRVSAYEHVVLAMPNLRCRQVRRTWPPGPAHLHRGQRR